METIDRTAPAETSTHETSLIADRVTEGIRALILAGELPPGSRIGQEELAARFSVSRIPVRVALGRLESDGLVVLKPSSGAWVARVDLAECLEIYMIRERLVEDMAASADTETFLKLDRMFHLASYADAGMKQLLAMIERFWNTTQHYRRAFTSLLGRERNWIIHAEHRLIVDAIRRRDTEGAAHLLTEHIRRTRCELAQYTDLFPNPETPRKARRKHA